MNIFQKIFGIDCSHQWEEIERKKIYIVENSKDEIPCMHQYIFVLRCKKCGDIKMKKYEF